MTRWVRCTEGPWEISDEGDLRLIENRNIYKAGSLIRWQPQQRGWLRTVLTGYDGIKRSYACHMLVAKYFLPPRPTPQHVLTMIDGNHGNCRASNLRWALFEELHARMRVLTPEQVHAILNLKRREPRITVPEIIEQLQLNCTRSSVYNIFRKRQRGSARTLPGAANR